MSYAIEAWGLSQRVGISRQEARKVIDDYYDTYKGVRRYMDEIPIQAREHGYVRSLYGRIRPLQGTASDIVKMAMLRADEAFQREKLQAEMLMQVHDELLVECAAEDANRVAATRSE